MNTSPDDDRDLVRVGVTIGGVKSSISMDGRLAHYLGIHLGGDDRVRGWVRETTQKLEKQWNDAASQAGVGERVRINTGLSRAIQREALDTLFSALPFPVQNRMN